MLAFPHPRQEPQLAPSSSPPVSPPLSVLSHIQQMQTELLDSALTMAGHSLHRHHPVDALPPNFSMDMAVLDRQAPGFRWQQLNPSTLGGSTHAELLDHSNHFSLPAGMFLGTPEPARETRDVVMGEQSNITTNPTTTGVDGASMACRWPEMTEHQVTNHHVHPSSFTAGPFTAVTESKPFSTLARTTSCPPAMGSVLSSAARMGLRSCRNIPSSPLSGDGPRKRKTLRNELAAAPLTPKVEGLKTIKGELLEADELGPDTDKLGAESSSNGGRENSKGAAPANIPKPDYIHVRARRGQATDSHSLAERVRREKISERMKLLQDLVPGCNKITGKAGMLDEIINYVQSLQRQVEFLSMKLAAVSPKSEGSGDSYLGKEVFPLCNSNFPGVGMPPEVSPPPYVHLNMMQSATGASIQQQQGGCGGGGGQMDISMNNNPSGMTTLRRTTSAPVTVSDDFIDSCFRDSSLLSNPAWDFDLQGLYTMELHHQPRQQPAFSPPTSFVTAGHSEVHNLKMEMM